MALRDLLEAIEAEADGERLLAEETRTSEATTILRHAEEAAAQLEAQLATAPEAEALAEAERVRALARLSATNTVRAGREHAFVSLLETVRADLEPLRESGTYPTLFRALLDESRAALASARELHVDPRDEALAVSLADGLEVVATLRSWGGVELVGDDGRTVRNTLEERLANAEPVLRGRFAAWLVTGADPPPADVS